MLAVADGIVERLESSEGLADLVEVRAAQTRARTLRGQVGQGFDDLDWLERVARGSGDANAFLLGLCSAAAARASLGHPDAALALLTEVEATPGAQENQYSTVFLPTLTRVAIRLGHRQLAERLVDGVEPRYPYTEHALVAANAAFAEAGEDLQAATEGYADAAGRWERFGVVPEQGFALLGQGRCLLALSRPTEAAPVLQNAREIFDRLQASPGLAETTRSCCRPSRSAHKVGLFGSGEHAWERPPST